MISITGELARLLLELTVAGPDNADRTQLGCVVLFATPTQLGRSTGTGSSAKVYHEFVMGVRKVLWSLLLTGHSQAVGVAESQRLTNELKKHLRVAMPSYWSQTHSQTHSRCDR